MARKPLKKIIKTTFAIIGDDGWLRLSLRDVAAKSDLSLAELHDVVPDRIGLLELYLSQLDTDVLKAWEGDQEGASSEEPLRDRIFDLLMMRIELSEPYRDGLKVLVRELPRDLPALRRVGLAETRFMSWVLDAVGTSTRGMKGAVKTRLLAHAYLATTRGWANSDGDLNRTMAELDRRLRRIERWITPQSHKEAREGAVEEENESEASDE